VPGYITAWLHWPNRSKNGSVCRMISRKNPRSSVLVTSSLISTPSSISVLVLVGSMCPDEVVDAVVGVDGLTGISPESADHVVLHSVLGNVVVVHVGYLKLAATGWLEAGDDIKDRGVIEIDTGDRQRAGRVVRLLDDLHYLITIVELRYTKVT